MTELTTKFNIEQELMSLFYMLVSVTKENSEEEDYETTINDITTARELDEFESRVIEFMGENRFLLYDAIEDKLASLHDEVGTPPFVDHWGEEDDRVKRHKRLVSKLAVENDESYDFDRIVAVLERFEDNPSYVELSSISRDLSILAQTTQEGWGDIKDWLEWHIDSYN